MSGNFDKIVETVLSGDAPERLRTAAARGALPLPRPLLARLYIALQEDPDEGIAECARNSLAALDEEAVLEIAGEQECPAEVLAHFTKPALRDEGLAAKIAFHRNTLPATLSALAMGGTAAVIDLVMTNEQKLLENPAVLERLMLNPAMRPDQRGRLLELLDRATKLSAEAAAAEGQAASEAGEFDEDELAEAARLLDVDVGELLSASEIQGAEEIESSDDPLLVSAFQKIITLGTAQKAILALKGGREERLILIRDTNKVVSLGVLRNPRISEQEVESIARMRNVSDEVLRLIGTTRDWVKKYAVAKALVYNPRSPQQVSMNFISRLSNRDLKELARSREIPELIRRAAKRNHDMRTQSQANALRKK